MLDRNSVFLVDATMSIQESLTEDETLVVLSTPDSSRCYLMKADGSAKGLALLDSILDYCAEGWRLRVIVSESREPAIRLRIAARNIVDATVSRFSKRCVWKYNYSKNSLKCSADPKIRVLIVDDSKTIRTLLQSLIAKDPELEVVGAVEDPRTVQAEVAKLRPDVMTLDIHMPGMNGVEVIRNVMRTNPVPTIMISSLGLQDGREVLTALQLGAVDYIQKPSLEELPLVGPILLEKLKVASAVVVKNQTDSKMQPAVRSENIKLDSKKIVCIGSSTGGTEAIRRIFRSMPKEFPPILITQHIPKLFSLAFAESLSREFQINAREATDGDLVVPNLVLIAPGGMQMEVVGDKKGVLSVRVFDGPPVNRHKPSVDVLFQSASKVIGRNAVGVVLTGMGSDGAKGLLQMREAGATTLAQDERSSIVFGMPKVAAQIGGVQKVCGLDEMAESILQSCRAKSKAA
jgi:two-component system, chemotaxis family, protein-glutamate methylesterase/glutaminase